MNEFKGLNHY